MSYTNNDSKVMISLSVGEAFDVGRAAERSGAQTVAEFTHSALLHATRLVLGGAAAEPAKAQAAAATATK